MRHKLRWERNVFLLFLGACAVALMAALPIVSAQTQPQAKKEVAEQPSAAAGATVEHPSFEQLDRNKDGVIDKSEAGGMPGLSALFERADRSKDGKLDPEEYAKGIEILSVRR
jgi:hypothetical protein